MALAVYKPRNPRKSPLFRLLEPLYDTVKGVWEERFESPYGFWRGRWDDVVARFLDCGDWNSGFARVRCKRSILTRTYMPSSPAGVGLLRESGSRFPT